MRLLITNIDFEIMSRKMNISIIHSMSLPEFNFALSTWASRTHDLTVESFCNYVRAESDFIIYPSKKYVGLN